MSDADTEDLPPSCRLTLRALDEVDVPVLGQDLLAETELPQSTFWDAIRMLEERDLVSRRTEFGDARQTVIEPTDPNESHD